jgi:hypothetical protein
MSSANGPTQAPELSLKFMAWNIKEIAGYLKEIAASLVILNQTLAKSPVGKPSASGPQPGSAKTSGSMHTDDDIPF